MRYLVTARVKAGCEAALLQAVETEALGHGSVAEGEYLRNMRDARVTGPERAARWVEVCYCPTPLEEERPYWEEYFELVRVQDAHDRRRCRDQDGSEPWACGSCDCTDRLESKLQASGEPFVARLRAAVAQTLSTNHWVPDSREVPESAELAGNFAGRVAIVVSGARDDPQGRSPLVSAAPRLVSALLAGSNALDHG